MEEIGLRELRQSASEVIRRVEAGEELEVTVSGRPAARLVPTQPKRWVRWENLAHMFNGPVDAEWDADRELIDQTVSDPWDRPRDPE